MPPTLESVLIIAQPGRMRDSLRALLNTVPLLDAVEIADSGDTALMDFGQVPPGLVLMDTSQIHTGIQAIIDKLKHMWPDTAVVILANGVHQHRALPQADAVLFKGYPISELLATIEHLLLRNRPHLLESSTNDAPSHLQ